MDVLTDLLERSRARGAAVAHTTAYGEWGLRFPAMPGLVVHAAIDGETVLWSDDPADVVRLLPGDLVLVRGGVDHHLGVDPGVVCTPLEELRRPPSGDDDAESSARRFVLGDRDRDGGEPTVFVCGAFRFAGELCSGLLQALPDVLHLRPGAGSALRATMELFAREAVREAPGQQTLLDRLLDVALIQVLREHLRTLGPDAPSWVRAMSDPRVEAALRAIHADPARDWTVAALAEEAALSRAAFARRFHDVVGTAPLAYVTDWRMALARERLRARDEGLAAVAAAVGYTSEYAFAAAFKRHHGVAPGRWRQHARAMAG